MDVTRYLEPRIAPRAIFDALPERATQPRFMVPAARPVLAAMLASYAAVLLAAAIDLSRRTRAWLEIPLYAAVFAIVQLGWGLGACVHVITFGRWPAWATVAQAHG